MFSYIWLFSNHLPDPSAEVKFDNATGVYRFYDSANKLWLVNSSGYYLYFKPETGGVEGGDTPAQEGGTWVQQSLVNLNTVHLVSMDTLQDMADHYGGSVTKGVKYWFVTRMKNGPKEILVDDQKRPYAAVIETASTAAGTPNNYYTTVDTTINNEGDKVEFGPTINDNSIVYNGGDTITNNILNIEDNSVWFPDGTWQFIDNLYYDESTHTYYVDSHDSYQFDVDQGTYITNRYTYEIQYHIDYTSITYIGQTAEYDKQYECYYELPDGRSSADLTAADLEQLSLVFSDVVNYARSADDVSQRVLYHFDGDTQDSSYWSYCTDFRWDKGASLTYMDEGTFGGSLYLDETEHDFTITLPSNDAVGDFTLQFRYYQSHTEVPAKDSYIELSGIKILQTDGAKYYNGSGTVIATTSIGAWNELCFMRKDGTLYYYINGVPYGSVSGTVYVGSSIRFYFGSTQQTFKKLDELRFTKRALYKPGQPYAPMAVPYDTNLALILPDGDIPVADEYMEIISGPGNKFAASGLDRWTDSSTVLGTGRLVSGGNSTDGFSRAPHDFMIGYRSGYASFSNSDGGVNVHFSGTDRYSTSTSGSVYYLRNALFLPHVQWNGSGYALSYFFPGGVRYCLSVVLTDGSYSYVVFEAYSNGQGISIYDKVLNSNVNFTTGYIGNDGGTWPHMEYGIMIYPSVGNDLDIAYMELVEGTQPTFALEWKTAVYSSGQLEDSPVLAVRSNLDITSYQIGGVRPSYPHRGQVWALVENSRISSLQQFNGSAWTAVDGRIWTGSRWIPYSSFDVFTLKDLWDMVGGVSDEDYTYIYTESGFWDWWQRSWNAFTGKLFGMLGGNSGDSSPGEDGPPLVSDEPLEQEDYRDIVKLLRDSYGFFSGFFSDFTVGGMTNFLDFLVDENSDMYGIFGGIDWGE